jgi:hypothetical protein
VNYTVLQPSLTINQTTTCENVFIKLNAHHELKTNAEIVYTYLIKNHVTQEWDSISTLTDSVYYYLTPDLTFSDNRENIEYEFKCIITNNYSIQETNVSTTTLINIGNPTITSYGYMCGEGQHYELNVQHNGRPDSNFNYVLYKYNQFNNEFDSIQHYNTNQFIIHNSGKYFVNVISKINESDCSKITNMCDMKLFPSMLQTEYQKIVLDAETDSIIIYVLNYNNDEDYPITINWYRDDSLIVYQTGPYIVITEPGNYYAIIGNEFCTITSNTIIVTQEMLLIGVEEHKKKEKPLLVYPNPTTGIINISSNDINWKDEIITYEILDGKFSSIQKGTFTNENNSIDVRNKLSKGIYLIKLYTDDELIQTSIIILK